MKVPIKPRHRKSTPFYWWRRFRTHKSLPYKATLLDKIKNGDFEYPAYFEQANWELAWMKDEQKEFIVKYLSKEFKINRDKVKDIMDEFGDTTEKLYFHIASIVGINVDTLIKLKSWKR